MILSAKVRANSAEGKSSPLTDDTLRIRAAQATKAHQSRLARRRGVMQTTNTDSLERTSRMLGVALCTQARVHVGALARRGVGWWGSWHADCSISSYPLRRSKAEGLWPRSLVGSESIESGGNPGAGPARLPFFGRRIASDQADPLEEWPKARMPRPAEIGRFTLVPFSENVGC